MERVWLACIPLFIALNVIGRSTILSLVAPTIFAFSIYAAIQYFILFPMSEEEYQGASVEFVWRLQARQPMATFIGPNQLAAFLTLTLPLLLGSAIDGRGGTQKAALVRITALIAGFICLLSTGSLGGWMALVAGRAHAKSP